MTRLRLVAAALLLLLAPRSAESTGFTDLGYDVLSSRETRFAFDGSLRLRSALLYNLDLDRGETPSGSPLYPVSLSEPERQSFYAADLRVRTDLAAYVPGGIVAFKLRVDLLGNSPLGGSADGIPGGSLTQQPADAAFILRRAYGEVVTPLGYLAAGRMGNEWGLGMLANSGDCSDCDYGDTVDRIVFVTAAVGHIFAVAYDFSASGHLTDDGGGERVVDVEPAAAVRTFSTGILRWRDDFARDRRRRAGKTTVEYGLFYALRWQDTDVPAAYLPVAHPVTIDSSQVVMRDLRAHAIDLWCRVTHRLFRIELEAAYLHATVGQSSMLPGFVYGSGIDSDQFGFALESQFGPLDGRFAAGIDAGFASGDPAPGFGARPPLSDLTAPVAGDLDGPQAMPPDDSRVDNFRFHPDYHVDRILFREIIGTVTDALYVRPHVRYRLIDLGSMRLDAALACIASWAHYAGSTPGQQRPLGVEIDPSLELHNRDGFAARLDYGVLFPLAGLDNPSFGLGAQPAQLLKLSLAYGW